MLHLHRPHIWRPSPRFAIPAKQKPRSNIPRLLLNVCGDRPGGFRSARPIQSCIDNQRAGVRFQKEEGRGDFGSADTSTGNSCRSLTLHSLEEESNDEDRSISSSVVANGLLTRMGSA